MVSPGDGGALGRGRLWFRWSKIFRMAAGSVTKAMIFISAPHRQVNVHIINPVDELGPSFGQSAAGREMLARLIGCVAEREGGADAVGVGAIEMDEVLVGLRDVDEHASEELEWVDQGQHRLQRTRPFASGPRCGRMGK